jgi:hypothetical protein
MNSAHKFAWYVRIAGVALLIGSWFNVVPRMIGLIGLTIGLAASLLSRLSHRYGWEPRPTGPCILCDSCRLNAVHACWRPERPNATACDDYDAM